MTRDAALLPDVEVPLAPNPEPPRVAVAEYPMGAVAEAVCRDAAELAEAILMLSVVSNLRNHRRDEGREALTQNSRQKHRCRC